jgi:AcrR family transcriptional regulator
LSTEAGRRPARKRMSAAARRELIELRASELFAERGYRGASIEEIARRSGVTAPVVYDHFSSKRQLYRHLLERHFAELRALWRTHLPGPEPAEERIARSVDAWFAYMEAHPFAARLLFRRVELDPEVDPVHAEVAGASRAAIMTLFAAEPGSENLAGSLDAEGLDMAWVVLRGILQGLADWWYDHPDVPRERVVATAMNGLWLGFDRVSRGETWAPDR